MNAIWGVTEPQFVTAYGFTLAGAIVWARALRERALPAGTEPSDGPTLTTDELAYLAGGPRRAVQTSVARLLDSGVLRIGSDRRLSATGRPARNQLDMAVLARIGCGSADLGGLVRALREDAAVTSIRTRLVRLGLLTDPDALRLRMRHAVLPMLLLGSAGLLYWLDAVTENEPIGWVTLALAITAVAAAITTRPAASGRTLLGERRLATLTRHTAVAADHGPLGVPWSAARSVAVGGLGAYPDPPVRGLLVDVPAEMDALSGGSRP